MKRNRGTARLFGTDANEHDVLAGDAKLDLQTYQRRRHPLVWDPSLRRLCLPADRALEGTMELEPGQSVDVVGNCGAWTFTYLGDDPGFHIAYERMSAALRVTVAEHPSDVAAAERARKKQADRLAARDPFWTDLMHDLASDVVPGVAIVGLVIVVKYVLPHMVYRWLISW